MWNSEKVIPYQLDFFKTKEQCLLEEMRNEFKRVAQSADKVRKGLFARNNEIAKAVFEISARLDILEKHICASK